MSIHLQKLSFLAYVLYFLIFTYSAVVRAGEEEPVKQPSTGWERPGNAFSEQITMLRKLSNGHAVFAYHPRTGQVTQVSHISIKVDIAGVAHSSDEHSILIGPETYARNFLDEFGGVFGIRGPKTELRVKKTNKAKGAGRSSVRFQQFYGDIPVLAGEVVVRLDRDNNIIGASGELSTNLNVVQKADITPFAAQDAARELVIKRAANRSEKTDLDHSQDKENINNRSSLLSPSKLNLSVSNPELWIYNPSLLDNGQNANTLVWRVEVSDVGRNAIDEVVFVNATTGAITFHFSQIHHFFAQKIYDNNNTPGVGLPSSEPARIDSEPATGIADIDQAHEFIANTYDFYFTHHARKSLDDNDAVISATVRYCPDFGNCPSENAFWNRSANQLVFGQSYAVDDVVAHEYTHGVTSFESSLIYFGQSGAINESLSDLWGELVDLTNNTGNDSLSVRWLIGEDLPEGGAVRDMKNPPLYNQPDRIGSPLYSCSNTGSDAVYINSGVNNKAAYLMVDGGGFNGISITGLGLNKVAKLYYEVQTAYLTSGSSYRDLSNALQAACTSFVGVDGITVSDCNQVTRVLQAVEMNTVPACTLTPAPKCGNTSAAVDVFLEDFETGLAHWNHSPVTGLDAWSIDNDHSISGVNALHGDDLTTINESYVQMLNTMTVPANAYMHFRHSAQFEYGYDGGIVEYSTDNDANWTDAESLFTHNGYSASLFSSVNPLGVRDAFTGATLGYTSSRLDLASLAGRNVQFRFRIGTDDSVAWGGWSIDDVRIYTCEGVATEPEIISPIPGSVLSGMDETFAWIDNGTEVSDWWFYIGSTVGANDIYNSGSLGIALKDAVTVLPADSHTLYIRLWYKNGGNWQYIDTTYTASSIGPDMIAPVPEVSLSGGMETFNWTSDDSSVSEWWLNIGSTIGAHDIYRSGSLGLSTTDTVYGLPINGSSVYVRLWFKVSGRWVFEDFKYKAAILTRPKINFPTSGSTLSGTSETFSWLAHDMTVSEWWLQIGSAVTAHDIYNSGSLGLSTTGIAYNLPVDGRSIYVRLWFKVNGSWMFRDYNYTAATLVLPAIIAPVSTAPAPTISASSETFHWLANDISVSEWWLYIGSAQGWNDIYDSGSLGLAMIDTVDGFSSDGSNVYVRLWYRDNGYWYYVDYIYVVKY